jgi:hypothetical protein
MATYSPTTLAVRIIYFSAENSGRTMSRMSSDFEIIRLGGDHGSMTIDPTSLANYLQARLLRKGGID